MKLQTRLYVTIQGCPDVETARESVHAITVPLDELYNREVISGYQLFILKTKDDYDEYDLDGLMIERQTHGVFPAIFLNVTYRIDREPPDDAAIKPLITEKGFRHLLTESDDP